MKLNDENIALLAETSLLDLLLEHGFNENSVIVELNGKIIKKAEFNSVLVKNDDTLEIFSLVGGG